ATDRCGLPAPSQSMAASGSGWLAPRPSISQPGDRAVAGRDVSCLASRVPGKPGRSPLRFGAAPVRTALGALGGGVGLSGREAASRLWIATVTPNVMVLDAVVGWAHRPGARRGYRVEGHDALVEFDQWGMRGTIPRRAGMRTLILGDSFADGLEVGNDELFSV